MAFQLSPGVRVREIDLTNIIPAVSTSVGGFAGFFRWGPINEIVTVSSERELISYFGTPNKNEIVQTSFFTAASYLKYSQVLRVVRAGASEESTGEGYINAIDQEVGSAVPILIRNYDEFEQLVENQKQFSVAARYAGALGNSLAVVVLTEENWNANEDSANLIDEYKQEFDAAPDADEVHVLVFDEDGAISGVAGTILEKWSFLSKYEGTKREDGTNIYYKDVINERSNYIYFGDNIAADILAEASDTAVGGTINLFYSLSGGRDASGFSPDVLSGLSDALDIFADSEVVDIDLLFSINERNWTEGQTGVLGAKLNEIAESRKDLVAFISPPKDITTPFSGNELDITANAVTQNLISWGGRFNSSYVILDSTALYTYDKYNDQYIWIPASGHMAGLCANTDDVADPWYSPAGLNRGVIRGVLKIAFNPNKTRRDDLYKIGINPIVSFIGEGILLFGDKTSLARPSAFDRINVRRLFLVLEKAISAAARFQLFEFNEHNLEVWLNHFSEKFKVEEALQTSW
jgi:phage tail sheath protein FI